jgi:Tannase and feruloyl esterase
MEAQRDPQDFDGLISGAPAYDFTNIAGGFIKNIKAVFTARDSARTPVVTRDNLALIERTALEACDASDGIRDNVIGLPRECQLSLDAVKACSNDTAAADCLTRRSVTRSRLSTRPLPSGRAAGPERTRLHEAVPAARGRALLRRTGTRQSGLARRSGRLGRAREGAATADQRKARRRPSAGSHAPRLPVPATRRLQGVGQHGRREELRLQIGDRCWW